MNRAQYREQLQALVPPGDVWAVEEGTTLTALLDGIAEELARIDARIADLVNEADPRTTSELLADWERVAGLPDPCVTDTLTVDQRRANLVARLIGTGGLHASYYIDISRALGHPDATIEEFSPMHCNSHCNSPCCGEGLGWIYCWLMRMPQETGIYYFTSNSPCDEPVRSWGNAALECVITKRRPAHTKVMFAYGAAI